MDAQRRAINWRMDAAVPDRKRASAVGGDPVKMGEVAVVATLATILAASQVMLRAGGQHVSWRTMLTPGTTSGNLVWLGGILLGWVAGLGWAYLMTRMRLSAALPVYVGFAYGLTYVLSFVLLKEPVTRAQVVGTAFVLLGVMLLVCGPGERG